MRGVAYRIVGSGSDADDAVQDAWMRYQRSDVSEVVNLEAWLTTVVSRVSLNMLEARRSRAQPSPDPDPPDEPADDADADPEHRSMIADSIGSALMVVLDTLAPAERVAFVLHDIFAVPFDEIAQIVERSTPTTRQLASRARARVRGREVDGQVAEVRKGIVVDAFLAASRNGDFDALMKLLDPNVVLRADEQATEYGTPAETHGARAVSRFSRYARGARPAVLAGAASAAWVVDDRLRVVYRFTIREGRIVTLDLIGDPLRHAELDLLVGEPW
ncbi:MAG: sigma-70 family RNA polymerase sigma factor [Actinomycetia bacterium]|nr:sigma-70 family RNA polymerase sigma factor [Actinomycetes bacterium]